MTEASNKKNIIQLDMDHWVPKANDLLHFDIKPFLFKELMLKETEFREALEHIDWTHYQNKQVLVYCSNQAIIPYWAFMLISNYLTNVGAKVYYHQNTFEEDVLIANFKATDLSVYKNQRVLLKGCSLKNVSPKAYIEITAILTPIVKSLAYGESCSSVPIFKNI
jgi:hypothetical protein